MFDPDVVRAFLQMIDEFGEDGSGESAPDPT
jgi:response regulator RpfG family c-di-GMP phosphodiesterase